MAEAYQRLGRAGLIAGNGGNVSCRAPEAKAGLMLISPTGARPETIVAEQFIQTNFSTRNPRASSEWALHAAVYSVRPELNAVVHTHADACTALACLGEDLPAFHYEVLAFGGGEVRCAPYATFGTPALAALVIEAMDGRTACLLANHGMITAGASLEQAVNAAFQLERLCRQFLLARAAGQPRLLEREQIVAARERFETYQRAGV